MNLYSCLRPALFTLPPERAHRLAIRALQSGCGPAYTAQHASLATRVAGLDFINPVGVAAGLDKNAECMHGILRAGAGFIEVGTMTPKPQPGNPTPRVFRLVAEKAMINRLGFNNDGVEAAVSRLAQFRQRHGVDLGIVGGNIGKNKDSADANTDYVTAMRAIYPHVDYITANISSPNTPGLRALQTADALRDLIDALQQCRRELMASGLPHRPIFVKIAPDGDAALYEAIAHTALATSLDGLIISNTTLAREAVASSMHAHEAGGLSGVPLFQASTALLATMHRLTQGKIPLIGVGGVSSAADAYAKIRAGASLIQLYTALVYEGFGLIKTINEGVAAHLARDGFARVADAVGCDADR